MALVPIYVIGLGMYATSRLVPALLDFGFWSVGRVAHAVFAAAWGAPRQDTQMMHMRTLIREELQFARQLEEERREKQQQLELFEQKQRQLEREQADQIAREHAQQLRREENQQLKWSHRRKIAEEEKLSRRDREGTEPQAGNLTRSEESSDQKRPEESMLTEPYTDVPGG